MTRGIFFCKFIAPLILVGGIYLLFQQLIFYANGKKSIGTVVDIQVFDTQCKPWPKRKFNVDCTKFSAIATYQMESGEYQKVSISAGEREGRGLSIHSADFKIGQKIEIFYDLRNPSEAFSQNDFGIILLLSIIITLFGGISSYYGYFKTEVLY